MKKLLISALVAAMVLGLGSMAFAAAGDLPPAAFSDIAGHEAEGELTLLAALGVFSGEQGLGGAVKPDDPLTRAQFCKVVVEAFEKGGMAAALSGLRPNFVDEVPAWAWGYVNVATYMGVINGYEDGTFGAAKFVTYGEAITMLIRAVGGHKEQVGAGVWPYNYIFYGVDNGFNGPVDVSFASLPTTRGDMARMLFAAMQINKLDAKGAELKFDPEVNGSADTAVLAGRVHTGYVRGTTATTLSLLGEFDGLGTTKTWTFADPFFAVGVEDLVELPGLDALVVLDTANLDTGKVIFVQAVTSTNTFSGVVADPKFADTDSNGEYDVLCFTDGSRLGWTSGDIVTLNQSDTLFELARLQPGDECVVQLNSDGKAVHVMAFRWNLADEKRIVGVTPVSDSNEEPDITLPGDTVFDPDVNLNLGATASYVLNGAGVAGTSLAVDDVVKVATKFLTTGFFGEEVIAVSAVRQVVEGAVTDTRSVYSSGGQTDYATINGQEYVVSAAGNVSIAKGDQVKIALNAAGDLYWQLDYVALTPYAVALSYTEFGTGEYQATFDIRGEAVTYKIDGTQLLDACDESWYTLAELVEMQSYVILHIDTSTNTVITGDSDAWESYWDCCDYLVLAVDAANGSVTLACDTDGDGDADLDDLYFVDDPELVVYELGADGVSKTYIGLEGLKAGDWVSGDVCCCFPILTLTDGPTGGVIE